MHRGVFQCQRDGLIFRPFDLGRELTNWKKTEILLYLSRKRIWNGQQAEGGLEWFCLKDTSPHPDVQLKGSDGDKANAGRDRDF